MRVPKFGGTSVATSESCRKVRAIVEKEGYRVVVVSAMGKRSPDDEKITDLLLNCHELAAKGQSFKEPFYIIADRHEKLIHELGLNEGALKTVELFAHLNKIRGEIVRGASRDYVASRGEYLMAIIMACFLGGDIASFCDAKDLIRFDEAGRLLPETYELIQRAVSRANGRLLVIPGFYGSTPDDEIKTFSRGGSDVTGAIVARALRAEAYDNWTDVDGVFTASPSIVPDAKVNPLVSYEAMLEISFRGADVVHFEAIRQLMRVGIPTHVRNTNHPELPGTVIMSKRDVRGADAFITGITMRKKFIMIRVLKPGMDDEVGFAARLLDVFAGLGISVNQISTGMESMTCVVSEASLNGCLERLIARIKIAVAPEEVECEEEGIALIAVVGAGITKDLSVRTRLFRALGAENISTMLLNYGASEISMILGVPEADADRAVTALHRALCV